MIPLRLLRKASAGAVTRRFTTRAMASQHHDLSEDGVVILGAGPAGCLLANYLLDRGHKNVTILGEHSTFLSRAAFILQ